MNPDRFTLEAEGLKSVKLAKDHLFNSEGYCAARHIFLFDTSGSMSGDRITEAKKAAITLFNQLADNNISRNKDIKNQYKVWDHCAIGSFSTDLKWLTKLNQTNRNGKNADRFEKQLDSKLEIGGMTALRDAIAKTYRLVEELDKQFAAYTGRKQKTYLYVLSDEEDNSSSISNKELIKLVKGSDIVLNIIHISGKEDADLKFVCTESSGTYERVEVLTEITVTIKRIVKLTSH